MTDHFLDINPGDRVCDSLAHPAPAQLRSAGYKGIALYWKNTTRADLDRYHHAGIGTLLIHEWHPTDFALGADAGTTAGRAARAAADRIGYPASLPMTAADDTDVTQPALPHHVDYWRAFRRAYGQSAGLYGDRDVIEGLKDDPVDLFWQPNAWAWSGGKGVVHPLAHVLQGGDVHRIGVDDGIVLRPFRMWLGSTKPAVTVPQPTLRSGSTGAQVTVLQQQLKAHGWYPYPVDGAFGPRTLAGVKEMQRFLRVTPDGLYGPVTAKAWAARLGG